MSGRGRQAAMPPTGWRPSARRDGLKVEFVSEDGRQRRVFDFASLPGRLQVREELATAFSEATGPLGTWRRLGSVNGLWTVARKATRWLDENRPGMRGLAELTVADTRMLLLAMAMPNGDKPIAYVRAYFGYCSVVADEVRQELTRHPNRDRRNAPQPYTVEELRWITIAARGLVRRARARLTAHWQLVADLRAGRLDDLPPRDPRRCLAEVLDHYDRTGDVPRRPDGRNLSTPAEIARRAARGTPLKALLHLTTGEAWAFGVLLTALTGLNPSVVFGLPAAHARADAPDEPGIALVNAVKHRRGPRSAMTVPLTALPEQLHPAGGDQRAHVLNTSLTTAFGVFTHLLELTSPARARLGSDLAFVFYNGRSGSPDGLRDGITSHTAPTTRRIYLRDVLTGDAVRDAVLVGTSLDRLRKTYLHQHRRPVAHTPATLSRYLRKMRPVTEEGFHIVRDALDEQVEAALARRHMSITRPDGTDDPVQDTVLGSCLDFEHSPQDDGGPCRQSFLSCLDCRNARAFPRHLPQQLAVLDELRARQDQVPLERWVTEFAGRVAQLQDIVAEFEPTQREQARQQITDQHRHLAARLLEGELDPL